MNLSDKIVQTIPLETIWTDKEYIKAKRISYLTKTDIQQLLKQNSIHFIVAEIGHKLKWIETSHSFNFWKSEVVQHLSDKIDQIQIDTFADSYAYIASEWTIEGGGTLILLEKNH